MTEDERKQISQYLDERCQGLTDDSKISFQRMLLCQLMLEGLGSPDWTERRMSSAASIMLEEMPQRERRQDAADSMNDPLAWAQQLYGDSPFKRDEIAWAVDVAMGDKSDTTDC